jgi:demethylmenaquinone methyltransferase/2-methoxy-6-polyprenyl-1,4-benzoquinol methylase
MFDRIAHRYDLANRLLSMGFDVGWRKTMVRRLPARPGLRLLDLATGTGDVLITLARDSGRIALGIGLDRSGGMLQHGQGKVREAAAHAPLHLVLGDATCLAFPEAAFDVVTISFGIRNVIDVAAGLREMFRVLKPGGRAMILEFSLPGNAVLRWGYLLYFRHVLPRIGGALTGQGDAYRYLNQTVEAFPYGPAFVRLMQDAGFTGIEAKPLTFGIATLYVGDKASACPE